MSDEGDSQDETQLIEEDDGQEGEPQLPGMLEELKGDNPTIWGVDYYMIIYCSAGALSLVMLYLYLIIPDPEVQQMVMIQGLFSLGLLGASFYFRTKLQAQ